MKTPDCVIWSLTKKHNAFIKKSNNNQFSSHPLNLTGFHNAAQASSTVGVSASKEQSKSAKGQKRVFSLTLKHKTHHRLTKRKQNSQSKISTSVHAIKAEVNHAARTIQGLTFQNDKAKKLALKKLQRLHAANPHQVKGANKQ